MKQSHVSSIDIHGAVINIKIATLNKENLGNRITEQKEAPVVPLHIQSRIKGQRFDFRGPYFWTKYLPFLF